MTNTTETTFFQDAGATVTNTRFMISGQTYALAGITSVSRYVETPNRRGPIICGIIAFFLLLNIFSDNKSLAFLGIILLIIAFLWWRSQKNVYSVGIKSSSGENRVLSSTDVARVDKIIGALNDAIVHRG